MQFSGTFLKSVLSTAVLLVSVAVFSQTLGERIEDSEKICFQKLDAPMIFATARMEVVSSQLVPRFNPEKIEVGDTVTFSFLKKNFYNLRFENYVDQEYIDYFNEKVLSYLTDKFGYEKISVIEADAVFDEETTDADFYVLTSWDQFVFYENRPASVQIKRLTHNGDITLYEKVKAGKKGKKVAASNVGRKADTVVRASYKPSSNEEFRNAHEVVLKSFYNTFKQDADLIAGSFKDAVDEAWDK